MRNLAEALRWVQLAEWTLLAAAAVNVWRRMRDRASAWLALTFESLAIAVILAQSLPQQPRGFIPQLLTKSLIALIVMFPYLLYRFTVALVGPSRRTWIVAHVLTGPIVTTTFLLPPLPKPGDPRPLPLEVWIGFLVLQWVFLLGYVAWTLYRLGSGQPSVARKRMRTMSFGAAAFALVIATSAFAPAGADASISQIVIRFMGILVGPFFFLGFATPRTVRMIWRRNEETELREMEIGLVKALSRPEIADSLLPRLVALIGGSGAVLFDEDREVIGRYQLSDEAIAAAVSRLDLATENYFPSQIDGTHVLPMENGWLALTVGPFTPFFGTEELQMLAALAVLADLALGRAGLFELERKSRDAMRDFVAIASHDLRTPVTVIQGFTQLLEQGWVDVTDEEKLGYLSAIDRQVHHLDRLIGDLLTVSRIDVEELETVIVPVDVLAVANETIASVCPDEEVEVSTQGTLIADADPDYVSRMLSNYLRNASVYGKPPISVEIAGDDGWVTIRVRDHGPGVPEDFVPKLFGKFARVDRKKSKAVQGTGLGLSIVRGLARANGGEAWYEHNFPLGACFCVRLPRSSQQESEG